MKTSKPSFGLRIIITALCIGAFIIGLAAFQTYSRDIQNHFSEKLTELLPDLENSLAAL